MKWKKIALGDDAILKITKGVERMIAKESSDEDRSNSKRIVVKTYKAKKKWLEIFEMMDTTYEEMKKSAVDVSKEVTMLLMAGQKMHRRKMKLWKHIHEVLGVDRDKTMRFNSTKGVIEQLKDEDEDDYDYDTAGVDGDDDEDDEDILGDDDDSEESESDSDLDD